MRAIQLSVPGEPLGLVDLPVPRPGPGQVLVRVHACAVCRTDLHVVDGDLTGPYLPVIPGHEVVGTVIALGERASGVEVGARVGVPCLAWTCLPGGCRARRCW